MEFITDNFIWAIIIVIAVLMAIVGYIADKTDFGRKEFEKKVVKEKPKKEKVEKPKKEKKSKKKNKEVVEEVTNEVVEELPVENQGLVFADMNDTTSDLENLENNEITDFVDEEQPTNLDENNDLQNVETYDLNQDEVSNEVDTNSEEEIIDQSLFEPLPSIDQVFAEPVLNDSQEGNEEVALDESTEELTENTEEDVWKF